MQGAPLAGATSLWPHTPAATEKQGNIQPHWKSCGWPEHSVHEPPKPGAPHVPEECHSHADMMAGRYLSVAEYGSDMQLAEIQVTHGESGGRGSAPGARATSATVISSAMTVGMWVAKSDNLIQL